MKPSLLAVMLAALGLSGCVFGVTTAPPREYRGTFLLTIDTAITSECVLTPGFWGAERRGTCLYLAPGCHGCGTAIAKGTPLTILQLHDGPDLQTVSVRIGTGASATHVDRANWDDLKRAIAPAPAQ
jgi:hypothetical protein